MNTDRKEYQKEWRLKNKEKEKERHRKYRLKNKEKVNEYAKEYRLKNKQKAKEYREKNKEKMKEYVRTDKGIKSYRISKWKKEYKIIEDNWDLLYNIYINTHRCDICDVELIEGSRCNQGKCLDHDHHSGYYRGVLCRKCNFKDDKGL